MALAHACERIDHGRVVKPFTTTRSAAMSPDATAARLSAVREALGFGKAEMAAQLGIEPTQWSRFELGRRPLTLDMAALIAERFGVTMDFLILGRINTLDDEMARKIRPLLR